MPGLVIPDEEVARIMGVFPDLRKAIEHANIYWPGPCQDGIVWTKNQPIVIKNEFAKFKLSPMEWEPVFLNYHAFGELVREGLYFVCLSQADLASRIQNGFDASAFSDRYFVCSWRDAGKDVDPGSINGSPPYTGLNDCAHFVSECLSKAGIPLAATDVDTLVSALGSGPVAHHTKTLAFLVSKDRAQRIIQNNLGTAFFSEVPSILKQGDIIAFGNDKKMHIHSTLYLGNEQITHHTVVNHSAKPNHQNVDPKTKLKQNWEFESNGVHPRVTIIHFSSASDLPNPQSETIGWWKVTWSAQPASPFLYFFQKDGRVWWVRSRRESPLPNQHGYWFETAADLRIFWTSSGSYEVYDLPGWSARNNTLKGKCNDMPIAAEKQSR